MHALRGHAAQTDTYVAMDLVDPAVDFVGLARSLGVAGDRADTVAGAIDLIKQALAQAGPRLIEVTLDRAFKPM